MQKSLTKHDQIKPINIKKKAIVTEYGYSLGMQVGLTLKS